MACFATSEQLRGLPYEEAQKFGMPHVGCFYAGESVKSHRRVDEAACCVCGAPASNAHHDPPLGMGGKNRSFLLVTKMGKFVLKPALFAVCGSGTTGCHDGFHGGSRYRARWVWGSPEYGELWWSGYWLSHGIDPHSPVLYELGHWEIADKRDGSKTEVRHG